MYIPQTRLACRGPNEQGRNRLPSTGPRVPPAAAQGSPEHRQEDVSMLTSSYPPHILPFSHPSIRYLLRYEIPSLALPPPLGISSILQLLDLLLDFGGTQLHSLLLVCV